MHGPLNPPPGLAERTITQLRAFFDRQNHRPSHEHWGALADIASTLEDMADRAAEPKVYLSAVDPGVGKTQTVTHFARVLVSDECYRDVGVIVCVGRIAEAKALAADLALPRDGFSVLTSDDEANALGNPDPQAAQILITTQQRIERVCEGHTFASAEAFHYRQHGPRIVRAWDEAFLPGCTITVTGDDLLLLPKPIRAVSPDFAAALRRFAVALDDYADGAAIDVPDFEAMHGVSLWDVLATVSAREGKPRDDQHAAASALRTLNGRRARVRTDGKTGNTVLTYSDTLPADLAPLLVLDASGRVRETYRSLETHRGTIMRLREAVKDYSPLQVHVWRTSGSKSGFERQGDILIAGVADTIMAKPAEDWLVVTHKPSWKIKDVEGRLRRRLGASMTGSVQIITWGNHMATNAYADFPNVVLAGSLFMRQSHYTALTHLAQGTDVSGGLAAANDVRTTERGEHAHLVLQAICRGRVRRSDGAQCLPMSAYIIAATRSGIPEDIASIFPGCSVLDWKPGGSRNLKGRPAEAMRFIARALEAAEWVSYGSIADGIGMNRKEFKKAVVGHRDWPAAIADSPFMEARRPPRDTRGVCLKAVPHRTSMAA